MRDKRYLRIIQMRKHLRSYKLDSAFCDEVLMDFFLCSKALINKALMAEGDLPADTFYPYPHLDQIWVDRLVKEVILKQNKIQVRKKMNGQQQILAL